VFNRLPELSRAIRKLEALLEKAEEK